MPTRLEEPDLLTAAASEAGRFGSEMVMRDSDDRSRDFAARLITAQEGERARLARELHDDIGQRLADLSIALSSVKTRRDLQSNPELLALLESLQTRTTAIVEAVRQLSHDLHPSVLDHTSLREALKSHCDQFARQYRFAVTFSADSDLGSVDRASALCLYRVAQEILRNVAKHANARTVDVALRRSGGEVILSIVDDGVGFDYDAVEQLGAGLGLRSIAERVQLARGRLVVDSRRNAGTTVSAHLPIDPDAAKHD